MGIIRDLADWPDADRALVEEALHRHYFVHTITRIHHIGWKYGFIAFDVQTDKGPAQFLMRWQHDRAVRLRPDAARCCSTSTRTATSSRTCRPSATKERDEFLRYVYW